MSDRSIDDEINLELSIFGSQAIDQAICGIGAGCVSVLCMHPLDLLKVKFQVESFKETQKFKRYDGMIRRSLIVDSLRRIFRLDGLSGLYRGVGTNIIGNSSSWGFYFLWYSIIKKRLSTSSDGSNSNLRLNASQHLLASATSGVISTLLTNPIWVVRTRLFTTRPSTTGSYKNLLDGLNRIFKEEGIRGLWRGSTLALIGVSNGAIQFMTYEELKRYRRQRIYDTGTLDRSMKSADRITLSNLEYVVLSGASKLVAIGITYPYQVVRSRIQNQPYLPTKTSTTTSTTTTTTTASSSSAYYRSIPDCVRQTYRVEGLRAFYRGLATNSMRVLPGTCVTFVVYENLSRWMRETAELRT
ncbi:mitochondrial FAD carrier protein [Phakopsora pachyrhizi]|uniref:Mitochondrial FAD carrier protein n=1 Tax=Phakopsora pachyrhizi TaxID=170000 RepID=A0AAV0B0G6_PHAPC|nr:mitochondrial FAD carrier protein [Phakopsora pachyrhizi]